MSEAVAISRTKQRVIDGLVKQIREERVQEVARLPQPVKYEVSTEEAAHAFLNERKRYQPLEREYANGARAVLLAKAPNKPIFLLGPELSDMLYHVAKNGEDLVLYEHRSLPVETIKPTLDANSQEVIHYNAWLGFFDQ